METGKCSLLLIFNDRSGWVSTKRLLIVDSPMCARIKVNEA